MKNGINIKNQISFPEVLKALIELDSLQNTYNSLMDQISQLVQRFNSSNENTISFSDLYSSNHQFGLLQTISNQIHNLEYGAKQEIHKMSKQLKQLKYCINKARGMQLKINYNLETLAKLIVKLRSKKECQILIKTISAILKKRQKFQLKQINHHNQLLQNIDSLSQLTYNQSSTSNQCELKHYFKFETLKQIISEKQCQKLKNKQSDSENTEQVARVKEEQDLFQINQPQQQSYLQQSFLNPYLNYQYYQQMCYFNQVNLNENACFNNQFFYQQYPYLYNSYYPLQINQQFQ